MINELIKYFKEWFCKDVDSSYTIINDNQYLNIYKKTEIDESKIDVKKIKAAYDQACHNRDFEIDKFWSRASYFWGFIVLIFTGYFNILTSEKLEDSTFFQLCFISLGLIFSFAWYFVIVGSKHWQENWERHIDKLENYITGPLYQTVYYKNKFYSVSKINQILSVVVIFLWLGFLGRFLYKNITFPWKDNEGVAYLTIIAIVITFLTWLSMAYGFGSKKFKKGKDSFVIRNSNNSEQLDLNVLNVEPNKVTVSSNQAKE